MAAKDFASDRGRIVRFRCACGWEGEDLLLGGGAGQEFALVESFPCSCPGCRVLLHRFLPRAGVEPGQVESLAARRGDGPTPGGLPARALRAIAAEASSGRVLCPLCRRQELAVFRSGAPRCPACGGECDAIEIGHWR